MQTAVPVNNYDGNWHTTAAGRPFSHRYGYGKLDAYAIVEAAKTFESVKPQSWYKSPVHKVDRAIPEGNLGLKSDIKITKQQLQDANFERVEQVQVRMNANHGRRGDMSVDLISPRGFTSHIATERRYDMSTTGYRNWDFMTVAHWYVSSCCSPDLTNE
jgi:kexin